MGMPGIKDLVRALPRETFAKSVQGSFLAVVDWGEDEPPSSFETVDVSSLPKSGLEATPGVEIHEIAKSKSSPYRDRISVGRAPNCDVVLRYASVSKLHGYFHEGPGGQLEFVDVGSQLGTRLNGKSLEPNKGAAVAVGDVLLIGRVTTRVADARAVWDLLKAEERLAGAGAKSA